MRIKDLKDQIKDNFSKIRSLNQELYKLRRDNQELEYKQDTLIKDYFYQYLELGSKITFKNHNYIRAVVSGKETPESIKVFTGNQVRFQSGDVIQIVKKNKKSIVVKYILRNSFGSKDPEQLDLNLRIETDELFYNLNKDHEFQISFDKFVNRSESLSELDLA